MYIEPCCIDRQLPHLLRKDNFSFFQSNGDWSVMDLMKAISYMAEGGVAVFMMPTVDVFFLRTLRTYLVKDWYRSVILLTAIDQSELIGKELGSVINRVCYARNAMVRDSGLFLTDFHYYLVINGPLYLGKSTGLCHYSAYYGIDSSVFVNAIEAIVSRVKTAVVIQSGDELINKVLNKDFQQ